jgi:hypothetical protein
MRNVDDTLAYYKAHRPGALNWPFNPDGQCLKVCRWARDIGAMYPSALSAQINTPAKYRVYDLSKVKRGMVMYYDDPRDSNPYGHIVTCLGRDKGGNILTWTNSVDSNDVCVVRAAYFPSRWGDKFQFAATWLNGRELDTGRPVGASTATTVQKRRFENLKHAIEDIKEAIELNKKQGNDRLVAALERDLKALQETLREFT